MTHESSQLKSPTLIFFVVALTVFASEALVMLLFNVLPPLSPLGAAFADALLLVLLILPALHFFLFRPMVAHIRERGKIEEILHKNEEEQFKIMIRASLDGFWITDARGHFQEVNDAYCHMLDYSREALLSMDISGVEAIESPEETVRRIGKLLETGSDCFETRHRRRDGSILDVEVSANYSNLDGGRIYCFLRDITKRKQAERELRDAKVAAEEALKKLEVSAQSMRVLSRTIEEDVTERRRAEEELRLSAQILNSISDTIFLLDPDGNFVYLNEAAWRTRGYTREEMMGMTCARSMCLNITCCWRRA